MNIQYELLVFCKNFKKLREKEKLSKRKMAKILGIGVSSITLIENGTVPKRLSFKVMLEIYNNFGITPQEMISENSIIF
jgi:transcriptional regulator with XRE-family HTH domain